MNEILILDNSADLLNTMKYVLERKNYEVKTLVNTDNICREINEFQPDLLIADVFENFAGRKGMCKELESLLKIKIYEFLCILLHRNY
jgi:DNA-binding response OmpR family regulator